MKRIGIILVALVLPILLLLTGCITKDSDIKDVDIGDICSNYTIYKNTYVKINGTLEKTNLTSRWFLKDNDSDCRIVFTYSGYITQEGGMVYIQGRILGQITIEGIQYPALRNVKILPLKNNTG